MECDWTDAGPVYHEGVRGREREREREVDGPKEMQLISVKQDEWAKWRILQDDLDEVSVSVAELLTDKWEDMELGEIDD